MNSFYDDFDTETLEPSKPRPEEYRSPFQIDRDRIIHTSAFRRLQAKTQVFFSGEYDFYRTRLTHSLEVAQIGRSICARLASLGDPLGPDFFIDGDLVEAACLAHDIGHPPFGHTGERVLNQLMTPYGGFEGNAQTLRLLTQTIFSGGISPRGMNPSRAFLDAVLKYKTLYHELDNPDHHFLYTAQSDYLDFVLDGEVFPEKAIPGKPRNALRSVECQVMDWADDTAYSLNDLADGIQAGFINLQKLEVWAASAELDSEASGHVDFLLEAIRAGKVEPRLGAKIGAFIAGASLVPRDGFLSGKTNRHRFDVAIDPAMRKMSETFKRISVDLVFRTAQLQQLDHKSGYILDKLWEVYHRRYVADGGARKKGLHLLPAALEEKLKDAGEEGPRLICDYLASMTDGFALRTYKRLFDPDFGSIIDIV